MSFSAMPGAYREAARGERPGGRGKRTFAGYERPEPRGKREFAWGKRTFARGKRTFEKYKRPDARGKRTFGKYMLPGARGKRTFEKYIRPGGRYKRTFAQGERTFEKYACPEPIPACPRRIPACPERFPACPGGSPRLPAKREVVRAILSPAVDEIGKALSAYAREVAGVAGSLGSTEATFYPAIQRLLTAVLDARRLPFDVRTNTSQRRSAGGTDLPDLALYDGGDYVAVYGEVKTPGIEIADLARSAELDDQIGRYLGRTGVVLLTNVRAFGLLAVDPTYRGDGPVPPDRRRLLATVQLWPSATAMARGRAPDLEAALALAELVETAVTEFAPIAEPESLARILARQAKRAKADLPEQFSAAVQPLLDDLAAALGLSFEGPEGEEFLRSSLIQTAFYGLFASWTLWRHSREKREFEWRDLGEYLKIPFLVALFHEFRNPVRLRELGLAPHLDRATATLRRVDHERFFARFVLPHVVTGNGTAESPAAHAILYFYEPFLEAF
ncbi:MAG TPA: hypothetical protein VGC93_12695, partial [Thermoanaerobaculia bacterium]